MKTTKSNSSSTYRNIVAMDADTGEILDKMPVYSPKKIHSLFGKMGFLIISNNALTMLAESDLDGGAMRVLLCILSKVQDKNLIAINQSELAEVMGMQKSNFSTAMKKLVEKGIINENMHKIGRSKTYNLNPNYAWRGSNEAHQEAINNHSRYEQLSRLSKNIETDTVIENDDVIVTITAKIQSKVSKGNSQN